MLVSGIVGLLSGDRRSDRLSFCRQEAVLRIKFSTRLLVRAGGWVDLGVLGVLVVLGWVGGLCVSSVSPCLCGFSIWRIVLGRGGEEFGDVSEELVEVGVNEVPSGPRRQTDLALINHDDAAARLFWKEGHRVHEERRSEHQ